MALVTVTGRTEFPVDLCDAKEQCRVMSDDTTHDQLLYRLLGGAIDYIENFTGQKLGQQTIRQDMDGFPSDDVALEVSPITAVTSVAYDDSSNVEQTLVLNTDYWQSLSGGCPKLRPVTTWPATYSDKPDRVRITMTVGYTKDTIPNDLRDAVLVMVKELFDHGGDSVTGMDYTKLDHVKSLANPYRRWM